MLDDLGTNLDELVPQRRQRTSPTSVSQSYDKAFAPLFPATSANRPYDTPQAAFVDSTSLEGPLRHS